MHNSVVISSRTYKGHACNSGIQSKPLFSLAFLRVFSLYVSPFKFIVINVLSSSFRLSIYKTVLLWIPGRVGCYSAPTSPRSAFRGLPRVVPSNLNVLLRSHLTTKWWGPGRFLPCMCLPFNVTRPEVWYGRSANDRCHK